MALSEAGAVVIVADARSDLGQHRAVWRTPARECWRKPWCAEPAAAMAYVGPISRRSWNLSVRERVPVDLGGGLRRLVAGGAFCSASRAANCDGMMISLLRAANKRSPRNIWRGR